MRLDNTVGRADFRTRLSDWCSFGFRLLKASLALTIVFGALLVAAPCDAYGQVSPAEILNPRLKAAERTYLAQLEAFNHAIQSLKFPFPFALQRYVGLNPGDQRAADTRGLEFIEFHGERLLKISGDYNAAFNAALLTRNQRAARVFDDVARPILELLPGEIPASVPCDGVGFEISYHVRSRNEGFDYEGAEDMVVVLAKAGAFGFSKLQGDSERQDVLNRSEVYVDGKEFGLALGRRNPIPAEALDRTMPREPQTAAAPESAAPTSDSDDRLSRLLQDASPDLPLAAPRRAAPMDLSAPSARAAARAGDQPAPPVAPPAAATPADAARLQTKYQAQLDELGKDGAAKFHFVPYAPPSFVVFQKRIYLQFTLRNPRPFDAQASSIYKRAAQSFDLFLAPQWQALVAKAPPGSDYDGLDITVLNELNARPKPSSESVEFICPLDAARQFAAAEITNQDLINRSVVLDNGARIALNLQEVE